MSTLTMLSPAAERNKAPILAELLRLLPPQGLALEIASGSGQHIAHFAAAMPGWSWLASDIDERALGSIPSWFTGGPAPVRLDVLEATWRLPASHATLDLIYSANMLHIAPAAAGTALFAGAARHLAPGGRLIVYGPFIVPGEPTAPSNLAFDADLRARDPAWGLRSLGDVRAAALAAGLTLVRQVAMPANNLLLVFERTAKESP